MVKFNSKSTLWYRPDIFTRSRRRRRRRRGTSSRPRLAALKAKGTTPLGLGVSPDTWTLTDWFESIYLRQAGAEKYDQLFAWHAAVDRSVACRPRSTP